MNATAMLRQADAGGRPMSFRRSSAAHTLAVGERPPPLSPRMQLARAVLVLLFGLSLLLLLQLILVSSLQSSAAQRHALDSFRASLAKGTAPIGPADEQGHQLALGTPVAFLEIPSIGLRQVVGEGTSSGAMLHGPGHRRDTPLPGQIGTSVIFGRRAAFGGPFSDINTLTKGALIKVTTGQGVFNYRVLGVRRQGDPAPAALVAGASRLTFVTAAGRAFLPDGVLRVDADIDGKAVVGPARLFSASALPAEERLMAGDTHTLWVLALWLQALIALSVAAVWAWHRWGRAQAWVVFLPPLLIVGLSASAEVARLLPNLL
jgi:LPXTG-site transpeptidase (sortase) family protein